MTGLDANLLLYSLNPDSKDHASAKGFLREIFADRSGAVAIADYVLVELYVLLRNPAVMARPLSSLQAVELVTSYWKFPTVVRVENAEVMDRVWKLARREDFSRRRIFDVRLGETLRHHGVTHLATANVKDFQGLGFEKVWNPLTEETNL